MKTPKTKTKVYTTRQTNGTQKIHNTHNKSTQTSHNIQQQKQANTTHAKEIQAGRKNKHQINTKQTNTYKNQEQANTKRRKQYFKKDMEQTMKHK